MMTETATHVTRRVASALLLIGAALLIVGNTTHPIDADPTATSRLALATTGTWIAIHLAITLGVLAVVGGLAMLPRAITHPLGAAYARLGTVAAIVGGTTLAIVFGALDGYGHATLAAEVQRSSGVEREAIETVALALDTIDSGMTAVGILALFGISMAAFGAALVTSRIVPRWLGWTALTIGLAGTATGLLFAALGPTALVINGLFRPVAMAATLYFVALAVALRRGPPAIANVDHDDADPSPRQRPATDATGALGG
jgi:hypothetical protein